jgi:molybdopterin molybdotransferase
MVSIETAQRLILENISPFGTESVPILQGLGRVCAEDYHSPWDIPPLDNSEMDGYAYAHGSTGAGERFTVTGVVYAGEYRTTPVAAGETVKIMTGAPLPPGCDTVVPLEDVEKAGNCIRLTRDTPRGSHVRKRGNDIRARDLVINAGTLLRPQEIGMLASLGKTFVSVFKKAHCAILATGDELLQPGSIPVEGKIINSNSHSLAAQVIDAGAIPVLHGIARDSREETIAKIREGMQADFLIITGGASVGDRDHVKESIEALGGTLLFSRVNIKPGKPVAFAVLEGKPVFALPGNPVSAMVSFEQFVRPALLKSMGRRRIYRPVVNAVLQEQLENPGDRPNLIRGLVRRDEHGYTVSSTGKQSSNRLSSLVHGNGLVCLPPFTTLPSGLNVDVELYDTDFEMRETSCPHA